MESRWRRQSLMLRSSRRFLSYSFSILYVCTTKVLCPADGCPPFVERCRSSSPCCRIFSLKVKKEIDGSSSTGQTHIVFIRVAVRVIFIQTHKTHTKHILLFLFFVFFVPSYSFLGTPSRSAGSLRVFRCREKRGDSSFLL